MIRNCINIGSMDSWENLATIGYLPESISGNQVSLIIQGSIRKDENLLLIFQGNRNISLSTSILPLMEPSGASQYDAIIDNNIMSCFVLEPWWAAKPNSSISFDSNQVHSAFRFWSILMMFSVYIGVHLQHFRVRWHLLDTLRYMWDRMCLSSSL